MACEVSVKFGSHIQRCERIYLWNRRPMPEQIYVFSVDFFISKSKLDIDVHRVMWFVSVYLLDLVIGVQIQYWPMQAFRLTIRSVKN